MAIFCCRRLGLSQRACTCRRLTLTASSSAMKSVRLASCKHSGPSASPCSAQSGQQKSRYALRRHQPCLLPRSVQWSALSTLNKVDDRKTTPACLAAVLLQARTGADAHVHACVRLVARRHSLELGLGQPDASANLAVPRVQVVSGAKVPIVKLVVMPYGLKFDISVGKGNGIAAVEYIRSHLAAWPPLRPLVTILKLFLLQRQMNEVYTGGLSSFSLILSVIAFLKMHYSRKSRQPGKSRRLKPLTLFPPRSLLRVQDACVRLSLQCAARRTRDVMHKLQCVPCVCRYMWSGALACPHGGHACRQGSQPRLQPRPAADRLLPLLRAPAGLLDGGSVLQ